MEEDRGAAAEDEMMEEEEEGRAREKSVLMWGYLPGMSPQRSPLFYPVAVRMPDSAAGDRWMDVSGGGCGFAMAISGFDTGCGEKNSKRRRLSSAKVEPENKASSEETLSALPCLVTLDTGVRIVSVAAGGRHTLALSDVGQVWGWGYGGEGQLGLGSRMRNVSSPHPIPCVESASFSRDQPSPATQGKQSLDGLAYKCMGSCVKAIACGGRHSAAVTGHNYSLDFCTYFSDNTGALLTFGWGLHGQILPVVLQEMDKCFAGDGTNMVRYHACS
ncbi:hypothetical protein B296_00042557 [Ensete ventricosum]|uniref:Ultraviolet-B receptor UVR8 n=1 Tax=Ensete ventricosum TaxID=4639 RepID=A0A426XUY5_ENSVE|nr:hypothetical protein B296_00042557 [Ensete ventricosum]